MYNSVSRVDGVDEMLVKTDRRRLDLILGAVEFHSHPLHHFFSLTKQV